MTAVFRMALVVVTLMVAWMPGEASAQLSQKQKAAERKAISAFAAGQYQEAVNIYSELYADYRDPVYLRNIGRCYQKLKDPEKAIASFEEYLNYLNKGKNINAEERREISGYIEEMRALQGKKAPPPPLPSPVPMPPPAPAASTTAESPAGPGTAPGPAGQAFPPSAGSPYQSTVPPSAATPFPGQPITQPDSQTSKALPESNNGIRWVGKGALIFSGVTALVSGALLCASWSTYNSNQNRHCLTKGPGECGSAADSISALNLWSGITLGVAVVSAAAGGTILYLYPAWPTASGLQAGVAWRY